MPSPLIYLQEGSRILRSSLNLRFSPKEYPGNAQEICQQIVKDCWNGRYFQTSTGNFAQFWTRDFGWCSASLIQLGYEKEVKKTITYALSIFSRFGKVTTTITPDGKPYDFPTEAADSLPWLIRAMVNVNYDPTPYRDFLEKEVYRFCNSIIDQETGLVRADRHFSSLKDFAQRNSSCYDNVMVASLAQDLQKLSLPHRFKRYAYKLLIEENFWNGDYFYDDLTKRPYVAGDAQIFPFLLGIITDTEKLKKVIAQIQQQGLDTPFPLKYTASRKYVSFIAQEIFLRNYESTSIWTHMGPLYLRLVKPIDQNLFATYHQKYTELIEKHKNYREVFSKNGRLYQTPWYVSDQGMLWAANYLTL